MATHQTTTEPSQAMAATRGMNGVSSKSTLRVKVVGCDGMGELDLIKDMYMSVVIKEVTMSPGECRS